jgi:hypothetical protein
MQAVAAVAAAMMSATSMNLERMVRKRASWSVWSL